jgi:predicted RNA polymerase sigma factor
VLKNGDQYAEFQAAYGLILGYKTGFITLEAASNPQGLRLLRLLRADLLPDEPELDSDLAALIMRVATEDSRWNKRTQEVILGEQISRDNTPIKDAETLRQDFIRECPSKWYRYMAGC